ncbi:response regulator [Candidatus Woesearchaeota archaeon]|nr:response regulator [Candidatus Woesearchaeota archaeon]
MAKKVLIIDDEEDTRLLVKTLLEDEGCQVAEAKSGKEGIDKLKKKRFDLVLVDMFMPGISGREMCERVRKDSKIKNVKCAFLTVAQFSEEGKRELKKLGCLDYIEKPIDNEDFIKRVKKMLK